MVGLRSPVACKIIPFQELQYTIRPVELSPPLEHTDKKPKPRLQHRKRYDTCLIPASAFSLSRCR